jgi:hypothetical protein
MECFRNTAFAAKKVVWAPSLRPGSRRLIQRRPPGSPAKRAMHCRRNSTGTQMCELCIAMLDVSQMGDAGKAVEQFHTQRFSCSAFHGYVKSQVMKSYYKFILLNLNKISDPSYFQLIKCTFHSFHGASDQSCVGRGRKRKTRLRFLACWNAQRMNRRGRRHPVHYPCLILNKKIYFKEI